MDIKFFIGPMSKNVVDSIIEFQNFSSKKVGIIPSRRQIDYLGGYSNNWTTEQISNYSSDLIIMRDHGGPGQGAEEDDGYLSLEHDCKHFNYIHIDPWKKYSSFDEGSKWTLEMIKFCLSKNPKIKFEVGTEEAIRKFEPKDLEKLLNFLKSNLTKNEFLQIKYLVIQSGTSLSSNQNTGNFDLKRLNKMVNVAKKNNLKSKEHNGDYIPEKLIKLKMSKGLDSINIAPEFGLIETQTYLNKINNQKELFERYWEICYQSKKWVKWVSEDFDPIKQKENLIKICGHYVLSSNDFNNDIKSKFEGIDQLIKTNIINKLISLHE
jgi:hypothetical protein|tara:strand:- start:108 stop:1073 length:966 start_codon:yes stop_codon:yes gene_type:complete